MLDHTHAPEAWLPFEILCLSVLLAHLVGTTVLSAQHWFQPSTTWQNVSGSGASKPGYGFVHVDNPPKPHE